MPKAQENSAGKETSKDAKIAEEVEELSQADKKIEAAEAEKVEVAKRVQEEAIQAYLEYEKDRIKISVPANAILSVFSNGEDDVALTPASVINRIQTAETRLME